MSLCVLVIVLLLPSVIFANRPVYGPPFLGALASFSYKGMNSDGSYKLEVRYKHTFDGCVDNQYFTWHCLSRTCGTETSVEIGEIYNTNGRNPENFNWCQKEGVMTRTISDDEPFRLMTRYCCWVGGGGWYSLLIAVDLGIRSDTNKPNSSPVTTSISFIRVPQNCPRTYKLITFDPDSDQGRCRYGNSSIYLYECGNCAIPSGFALGQTTINHKDFCTLSYTNASTGLYGLEVVVEDFPQQNITLSYKNASSSSRGPYSPGASPLSRIPLQFTVKVEAAVDSCEEGIYLPKFIAPTPANGETIPAVINQQCEFIVNATASASSIHALIISGPLNITVNSYGNSSTQFVLRWTPRTEDLRGYFPVCFVAESNQSSTFYQSDMRCVLLQVGDGADPQPINQDPSEESANIVVGVRMVVGSTVDLNDVNQSENLIRQLQEELIKRGLPNSTTVRLRKVHQRDP